MRNFFPAKSRKTNPTQPTEPPSSPAPRYPDIPQTPGAPPDIRQDHGTPYRWFWSLLSGFLFLSMALTFADVVVWVEGVPQLHPRRIEKFYKEKEEIENAEQYVLLTKVAGWYQCLTCSTGKIYLLAGQIWKYGVTRKGEKIRYGNTSVSGKNLIYVPQFTGNYAQCLIAEKRKIYFYPLLPENLARPDSLRLVYPPGNMQDN